MSESTMFNLASIIQESAVDIEGKTVVLELHCRANGFSLKLRGERVA